jgi:RNA polymerase sigma factor (sigma-70 family)
LNDEEALATLSVRDRAIVVLRYWEDQSVAATAEALGVSAEMVRTRSVRALARLRERLGTDVELLS